MGQSTGGVHVLGITAHPAVDRLVSTAHELVIEGPSYRQRQNHQLTATPLACPLTTRNETRMITHELGGPFLMATTRS
jgi:hypothetical protein